MKEHAFVVQKGSDFYNKYFKMWNEKQKFFRIADNWFHKEGFQNANYCVWQILHANLTNEEILKYSKQLRRDKDNHGFSIFKKTSAMQKKWEREVISQVDFNTVTSMNLWYFYIDLPFSGSQALWHDEDTIYVYLSSRYGEIKAPDYFIPIKMSEYYKVVERLESDTSNT